MQSVSASSLAEMLVRTAAPCVMILFGIFVAFFTAAIILRGAVWLANKCLGVSAGSTRFDDEDEEEEDWDAYARPQRQLPTSAVPEPGIFKGMAITLIVLVASVIVYAILAVVADPLGGGGRRGQPEPGLEFAGGVCGLILEFVIWAGLLAALLPTSFGRGCLITLFLYLIGFVLFVFIAVVVFLARGNFP